MTDIDTIEMQLVESMFDSVTAINKRYNTNHRFNVSAHVKVSHLLKDGQVRFKYDKLTDFEKDVLTFWAMVNGFEFHNYKGYLVIIDSTFEIPVRI